MSHISVTIIRKYHKIKVTSAEKQQQSCPFGKKNKGAGFVDHLSSFTVPVVGWVKNPVSKSTNQWEKDIYEQRSFLSLQSPLFTSNVASEDFSIPGRMGRPWRAGKWTIEIGGFPMENPPFSSGIFQPAMFDETRG